MLVSEILGLVRQAGPAWEALCQERRKAALPVQVALEQEGLGRQGEIEPTELPTGLAPTRRAGKTVELAGHGSKLRDFVTFPAAVGAWAARLLAGREGRQERSLREALKVVGKTLQATKFRPEVPAPLAQLMIDIVDRRLKAGYLPRNEGRGGTGYGGLTFEREAVAGTFSYRADPKTGIRIRGEKLDLQLVYRDQYATVSPEQFAEIQANDPAQESARTAWILIAHERPKENDWPKVLECEDARRLELLLQPEPRTTESNEYQCPVCHHIEFNAEGRFLEVRRGQTSWRRDNDTSTPDWKFFPVYDPESEPR